ncbi:MAG: sugar ABC transporter permease, partial [Chloroflexi bacterium]|nr:sugar ABC transporter permease [Chloroflexota bacterium]
MLGSNKLRQVFSGRRGRKLRENITAYLMISPAMILIFIFGLFPVGFALYVSVHKWLIKRSDFRGITNYFKAVDNLLFMVMFAIAIGSLLLAYRKFQQNAKQASEHEERPWLLMLPAALHAATVYVFLRWIYLQLPEFLDIADKMRGLERTRDLFVRLLSEAFYADSVFPAWQLFTRLLFGAVVVAIIAAVVWRNSQNANYQWGFTIFWLAAGLGISLLLITFTEIQKVYAAAVETGEDPGIWPQIIMVSSGVILLILAWKLWKSSESQDSTRG